RAVLPGGALGRQEIVGRPAKMDRGCPRALRGLPRDRPRECPIDLERARSVAELIERAAIARGQAIASQGQKLTRGDVEKCQRGVRELAEVRHRRARLEAAAERAEMRDQ